jgi:uncharacterized low-complexity protein
MSIKKPITTLSIAAGTAFVASLAVANIANAADGANPFAMNEMSNGYMQLADNSKDMEGKCGGQKAKKDGTCGGNKAKKEGTCGGSKEMQKNMEGNCGNKKNMDKNMPMGNIKGKEGKCGEAKCGGNKK